MAGPRRRRAQGKVPTPRRGAPRYRGRTHHRSGPATLPPQGRRASDPSFPRRRESRVAAWQWGSPPHHRPPTLMRHVPTQRPQPSPHKAVALATASDLCHPSLVRAAYTFYSYRHQPPMKAAKEVRCRRQPIRWWRSCIAAHVGAMWAARGPSAGSGRRGNARRDSGGGAEARAPYRRRRAHSHQPGLCSDKWGASCPDVWNRGRRASPRWRCSRQWPPSGRCRSWSYEAGPAADTASARSALPYMRPPAATRRHSREGRPLHNHVIPVKAGIQGGGAERGIPHPVAQRSPAHQTPKGGHHAQRRTQARRRRSHRQHQRPQVPGRRSQGQHQCPSSPAATRSASSTSWVQWPGNRSSASSSRTSAAGSSAANASPLWSSAEPSRISWRATPLRTTLSSCSSGRSARQQTPTTASQRMPIHLRINPPFSRQTRFKSRRKK